MSRATVTSKGQVTIPKEVRDALGVKTGDRLLFSVRRDGVVEMRPTRSLRDLFGLLANHPKVKGRRPLTVEEMDEAIGQAIAEDHERIMRQK